MSYKHGSFLICAYYTTKGIVVAIHPGNYMVLFLPVPFCFRVDSELGFLPLRNPRMSYKNLFDIALWNAYNIDKGNACSNKRSPGRNPIGRYPRHIVSPYCSVYVSTRAVCCSRRLTSFYLFKSCRGSMPSASDSASRFFVETLSILDSPPYTH